MSKVRYFNPTESSSELKAAHSIFATLGLMKDQGQSMITEIRRGYSVKVIDNLVKELDITQVSLLKVLNVSTATLTRRRQGAKRLSTQESDRVYRVVSAYRSALQLFEGNRDQARRWLNQPAKALGGHTPLEHLDTEAGADAVQDLIGRIEHGVIS